MKIIYIIDSLGNAGAEISTMKMSRYFYGMNFNISIVLLRSYNKKHENELKEFGINVIVLKYKNIIRKSFELASIIKREKPDLVHSVLFDSHLCARFAKLHAKFIHIESLVNTPYTLHKLKDRNIKLLSFLFYYFIDLLTIHLFVDYFLSISESVKKHYTRKLLLNNYKITVVPRGREVNNYLVQKNYYKDYYRKLIGAKEDDLIVIHVGRQDYQKNHLAIFNALSELKDEIIQKTFFIFLGRKGSASKGIENRILKINKKINFRFQGVVEDVPKWLAASDLFLFPSHFEGIGGALIEALSAGLPIICNDIPVFREVIKDNENGYIIDCNDAKLFSSTITRVLKDAKLRKIIGEKNENYFLENYEITDIHNRIHNFYKYIIDKK